VKSVQLIFLIYIVSIGRAFQLSGLFVEFENCLHSSVCFGAKREKSVTCDMDLLLTNQKAPFTFILLYTAKINLFLVNSIFSL
jgi:hypothetical protein